MSRKSYDQRIKERWKQKQKREKHLLYNPKGGFPGLSDIYAATAFILPFLFGKRNR